MINKLTEDIKRILLNCKGETKVKVINWRKKHIEGIFLFNISVVILLLLRSAGYFHPYVVLSVNKVIMLSLILSVLLLGARNKVMFVLASLFWAIGAFFKIVGIDIWAERMGIYTYEAFFIGVLLLFVETFILSKRNK